MYRDKKVVVVMPAYNAEATLEKTWNEVMDQGVVDHVVVVDDKSRDATAEVARRLRDTTVVVHPANRGYGGNQKSCYAAALEAGADIVIMVHPDYQYTPLLIPMPGWKYVANRFLTATENALIGAKLSEYHTGYRAFSRELLETVDLSPNSDDFVFDNQMLAQVWWHGYTIAEVSCPTKYFEEASSINFRRSVTYGLGCLRTALTFRLAKLRLSSSPLFPRA